jgi:hypothetical protein
MFKFKKNNISKEICRFYNYDKKFTCNNFIQNKYPDNNKYII